MAEAGWRTRALALALGSGAGSEEAAAPAKRARVERRRRGVLLLRVLLRVVLLLPLLLSTRTDLVRGGGLCGIRSAMDYAIRRADAQVATLGAGLGGWAVRVGGLLSR